jgi:hypothetical protein
MIAKKLVFISSVLLLSACSLAALRQPVSYDPQSFENNYDNMFSAAISAGAVMSYEVEYQDKEHGLLKMIHRVGNSTYRITVVFAQTNFRAQGEVENDLLNPFIASQVKKVEDAIIEASRSVSGSAPQAAGSAPGSVQPAANEENVKPVALDEAAINKAFAGQQVSPKAKTEKAGGGHSNNVMEAQRLLNQKGYNLGVPDGKIGPKTKQAIMSFQKSSNLAATGVLTQETMNKLREPSQSATK